MIDCDLHIHSHHSFDSWMRPKDIVRTARLRGLSAISVTDHGTMAVYDEELTDDVRARIRENHGVCIVKGMEVKTNAGDVIGLFLDEEVSATSFDDAVAAIRDQGGVVVLPHPYHRDVDPAPLVDTVDLVEVRNGRCRPGQNENAAALAERTRTKTIGGSDAHMYWEIGRITTSLGANADTGDGLSRSALLESDREVRGSPLPYVMTRGVSFASGTLKQLLQRGR